MSEEFNKTVEAAKGKVQEVLDKTDVDEKIVDGAKGLLGKIGGLFKGKDGE